MAFQSNFPNNISGDNGSSIGDIKWSSADLTQAGFLVANGAEVGRATYPDLCAVYESMGFPWGAGDGSTTFNLPNLIGKFAEGADSAGGYHEAGLPNITGIANLTSTKQGTLEGTGCFKDSTTKTGNASLYDWTNGPVPNLLDFNASRSNPIYGNSDTVQPPSALLIPYVKAFAGASADSTDLAITELANDVANIDVRKLNKSVVKSYVVESVVNSDGSWYRKYSDGWLEQGGFLPATGTGYTDITVTLLKPFPNINYLVFLTSHFYTEQFAPCVDKKTTTDFLCAGYESYNGLGNWFAFGMGVE